MIQIVFCNKGFFMALAEILKAFMSENKVTADEISSKIGVSRSTITHWSNGIRKPKTYVQYQKLAKIMGIDDYQALMGGELLDEAEVSKIVPIAESKKTNIVSIGVLDMVAGFGTEGVLDPDFRVSFELALPKEFLGSVNSRFAKIIKCLGDSMEPAFHDGDYLLIEMLGGRKFIKRAGIYLVRLNDIVYIKRVEFMPDNDLRLISLNPCYSSFTASSTGYEYEILGCVYGRISVKIGAGFQFDNQGIK